LVASWWYPFRWGVGREEEKAKSFGGKNIYIFFLN
jgi:hypothetical protein